MHPRAFFVAMGLVLAAGAFGCSGKQRWSADMNWQGDSDGTGRPFREASSLTGLTDSPDKEYAWVGVRHDLIVAPDVVRKEVCACLHVEVGNPGDAKFQWQNGVPAMKEDLMAIAITAKKLPSCRGGDQDESKRRASISAVDREGPNVYVEVEDLPLGRPIATGALFVKPGPNGNVYVRPKNRKAPYAAIPGFFAQACKVF